MNFKEAHDALQELADGRYHSICFEIHNHTTGTVRQECVLYIDGYGHFKGETWEEALHKTFNAVHPPVVTIPEIPEIEAAA